MAFTVLRQNPETVRGRSLFSDALDYIYAAWEAPLAAPAATTIPDKQDAGGPMIDGQVFLAFTRFNTPVGLTAGRLFAAGGATQSVSAVGQACKPFDEFAPAGPNDGAFPIFLSQQSNICHALLAAVNDRAWIAGLSASAFHPPVALRDRWLSVRGKPAEASIAAWYRKRT